MSAVRRTRVCRSSISLICKLFMLALLLAPPMASSSAPAVAQDTQPTRPFARILVDWNRSLERVEQYLKQPSYSEEKTKQLRVLLIRLRQETAATEKAADESLTAAEQLLATLGAEPADAEPAEPESVRQKRAQYNKDISDYKARVQQAQLARARADQLDSRLSKATTTLLVDDLLTRMPLPYMPGTVERAIEDYWQLAAELVNAPKTWWRSLPPENRRFGALIFGLALIGVTLATGFLLRIWILRRFGRDPAIEDPSYSRRFFSAFTECLARGIVPALLFTAILLRIQSDDARVTGFLLDALSAFCGAMIFLFLAVALVRAVLAPDMPAWQLTALKRRNAVIVGRRVILIIGIIAADFFIRESAQPLGLSQAFWSVQGALFGVVENILILLLLLRSLWEPVEEDETAEEAPAVAGSEPSEKKSSRFWAGLRILVGIIAFSGIVAFLAGYSRLGDHINEALITSAAIAAVLFLLRGLLREIVGIALRSELAKRHLALPHTTRSTMKFWVRALLDAALIVCGVVLMLIVWGVPADDLSRLSGKALTGFEIGSVTISITDIVTSLVVFALVLAITRVLQRALSDRVLPETHLAVGVQHSLAAGFGYVGIILAITLTLSTLGIDLSNIALIAGALSVGIGFGLQNVVNNFVSGLILLIERPIQVGDWVVVGTNEGRVKRISVRATEIETFQRASVIVPNAELLSNSVTNWTHKNNLGRVEIAVGVAYGSDTEKVRDILLECAKECDEVLAFPEPFVLFLDFGNSSLDFELRCYVGDVIRRLRVATEIRYMIDRRFREEGVEIPFPQHVVHMAPAANTDRPRGPDREPVPKPDPEPS